MKKSFAVSLFALLLLHAYAFSEECELQIQCESEDLLLCTLEIQNTSLDCLQAQWDRMASQLTLLENNKSSLKDSLNSLSVIMAGLEKNLALSKSHLKMARERSGSIKTYNAELKTDFDNLKSELDKMSKELKKSEFRKNLYFYGGISIITILTGALIVVAN